MVGRRRVNGDGIVTGTVDERVGNGSGRKCTVTLSNGHFNDESGG